MPTKRLAYWYIKTGPIMIEHRAGGVATPTSPRFLVAPPFFVTFCVLLPFVCRLLVFVFEFVSLPGFLPICVCVWVYVCAGVCASSLTPIQRQPLIPLTLLPHTKLGVKRQRAPRCLACSISVLPLFRHSWVIPFYRCPFAVRSVAACGDPVYVPPPSFSALLFTGIADVRHNDNAGWRRS